MKYFPFILITLANTLPLIVGIFFYQNFFGNFESNYIVYTILFWFFAIFFLFVALKRNILVIKNLLLTDLKYLKVLNYFIFFSFFMFLINYDLIFTSRNVGLNVTSFKFKLFFLFEDIYILTYYLLLFKTFIDKKFLNIVLSILFSIIIIGLFGRFIIITSFLIFLLLVWVHNQEKKTFYSSIMLGGIMIIVLYFVENFRNPESIFFIQLLDRISEAATLSIVDQIMKNPPLDYFKNFENLIFLYIPSVIYPAKPFINDGFSFMIDYFGYGSGETFTRFPILLHIDSFRRFGWYGLIFSILPTLVFYYLIKINFLLKQKFMIPFSFILTFKYLFFLYPRAILGIIEISLYTYVRSVILLMILFYLFKLFFYKEEIS